MAPYKIASVQHVCFDISTGFREPSESRSISQRSVLDSPGPPRRASKSQVHFEEYTI